MHLINNKYLKEYSPIPLNFNLDEVNNYIGIAEDIWVKPLIGDEQYDELIQQIEAETITEENQTLLLALLVNMILLQEFTILEKGYLVRIYVERVTSRGLIVGCV